MNKKPVIFIICILNIFIIHTLLISAPAVFPTGVTIYSPDKCFNGYTLFSDMYTLRMIDMNGNIVKTWEHLGMFPQPMDNDGNCLTLHGRGPEVRPEFKKAEKKKGKDQDEGSVIKEVDWDNNVVWSYISDDELHHDIFKTASRNVLSIAGEVVPTEIAERIEDPFRQGIPIHSDYIIEVNPEGEVVWEWHEYQHIDINLYSPCDHPRDWTHTNTVYELPENELGKQDQRFKAGNIMINPRNLNTLFIIDKETDEIVWSWGEAVLDHPHSPYMLPNGNIVLFNNGLCEDKGSSVIELNPATGKLVWVYYIGRYFDSPSRSNAQKLPNGNYLVCESDMGRIFEVTQNKEIVWEFVDPVKMNSYRAFRIPYDHCPQTEALSLPEQKEVTPVVPLYHIPQKELKINRRQSQEKTW